METTLPSSPSSSANHWILVVDDEPPFRQMVEAILATRDWTVRLAGNAVQAMAEIDGAPTPPSILLCDVMMPGVDGFELTRRIVARLPKIKVILISGSLTQHSWWPTDLRECRFLQKPFTHEQLLDSVNEARSQIDGAT